MAHWGGDAKRLRVGNGIFLRTLAKTKQEKFFTDGPAADW